METKKLQGIYKISFTKGDKFFPKPYYLGISKNIEARWEEHKTEIRSFHNMLLNFEKYELNYEKGKLSKAMKDRFEHLKHLVTNFGISAKYALYEKMACFMILNDYQMKDIKFEIVQELDTLEMDSIHYKVEQKFIRKNDFEAERLGFNGPNARSFAILNYLRWNLNASTTEKEYFTKQMEEISENFKRWKEKNHSIVVDWNLKRDMDRSYWLNWMTFITMVLSKAILKKEISEEAAKSQIY